MVAIHACSDVYSGVWSQQKVFGQDSCQEEQDLGRRPRSCHILQRRRKEVKRVGRGGGGAKFDGHHGGRVVPLPQPARGVL